MRSFFKLIILILALWLATILIMIRSIYRIVELQGGFIHGVASNEVAFMILEGPMIILATLTMTVFHPGIAFQGHWKDASWSLRRQKRSLVEDERTISKEGTDEASNYL
jgi:hypothetical protein